MTISNPNPFLPTQRYFPEDSQLLTRELYNSYVDIAKSVNLREIGVYSQNLTATGQTFELLPSTASQEAQRIVFVISSINGVTSTTAHNLTGFTQFTRIYGVAQTATDWRPIPYASATLVTNQIELKVDNTNITIINGATAPTITQAIVVIEFI
jgi:hypothetical protein